MRILLVSCYDLGRQPVAVASACATLKQEGHHVDCIDLAVNPLPDESVPADLLPTQATTYNLIAISTPMHAALRIGIQAVATLRKANPKAHICFFGYYGWLHAETLLDKRTADSILGGEPEASLAELATSLQAGTGPEARRDAPAPNLTRPTYPTPDRSGLPDLGQYARYMEGDRCIQAGAVETTRGCKVLCTHCPIPPVYGGRFLVVPVDVVLEDITQLVEAGAGHITFADPDFLNGPGHALKVVRRMHQEFPELTFDFTARIRHLLDQQKLLPEMAASGARFVVSAVEILNPTVLEILDKGHTPEEARQAVKLLDQHGITLRPSLLPFTPWATMSDYEELLDWVEEENLVQQVDPVHFSIRLLVPPGSLLLKHEAFRPFLEPLDEERLSHPWTHPDPAMDRLYVEVSKVVEQAARAEEDPVCTFENIRAAFAEVSGIQRIPTRMLPARDASPPPRLTEYWFC